MAIEIERLDDALKDPTQVVYLVVAQADSEEWAIAQAVEQELAGVVSVRAQEQESAKKWLTQADTVSVIFDWDGNAVKQLTLSQTRDKDCVLGALSEATET